MQTKSGFESVKFLNFEKKNVGKVLILYGKLQESLFFEIRKF